MNDSLPLLYRLDEIGKSLEKSGHALALIGLGSVGLELERLDQYSDLDFFVIVQEGHKLRYLQNLDWLTELCPAVYYFLNSPDGYKLLFQDGVFCEFAVFEQHELSAIPFTAGRVVWKQPWIDEQIAIPTTAPGTAPRATTDWLLGEALTNLYVGLGRYQRGEKLSAMRFIQQYAVDRISELAVQVEASQPAYADPFSAERRFERRFPGVAHYLPDFLQGYERSRESALAILAFLERHFQVNQAMAEAIRRLAIPAE
jgi:hypothetical protein